jgi:hypothetical protein
MSETLNVIILFLLKKAPAAWLPVLVHSRHPNV